MLRASHFVGSNLRDVSGVLGIVRQIGQLAGLGLASHEQAQPFRDKCALQHEEVAALAASKRPPSSDDTRRRGLGQDARQGPHMYELNGCARRNTRAYEEKVGRGRPRGEAAVLLARPGTARRQQEQRQEGAGQRYCAPKVPSQSSVTTTSCVS